MPQNDDGNDLTPSPEIPPVEDVKKVARRAVRKKSATQDDASKQFAEDIRSEIDFTHLKGIKDHYWHKGLWSYFLMFLMLGMLVFQSVLLGLLGSKQWDFSAYPWLLPALLVQNLAQIVGLAVFVVKALFKDMKSQ